MEIVRGSMTGYPVLDGIPVEFRIKEMKLRSQSADRLDQQRARIALTRSTPNAPIMNIDLSCLLFFF